MASANSGPAEPDPWQLLAEYGACVIESWDLDRDRRKGEIFATLKAVDHGSMIARLEKSQLGIPLGVSTIIGAFDCLIHETDAEINGLGRKLFSADIFAANSPISEPVALLGFAEYLIDKLKQGTCTWMHINDVLHSLHGKAFISVIAPILQYYVEALGNVGLSEAMSNFLETTLRIIAKQKFLYRKDNFQLISLAVTGTILTFKLANQLCQVLLELYCEALHRQCSDGEFRTLWLNLLEWCVDVSVESSNAQIEPVLRGFFWRSVSREVISVVESCDEIVAERRLELVSVMLQRLPDTLEAETALPAAPTPITEAVEPFLFYLAEEIAFLLRENPRVLSHGSTIRYMTSSWAILKKAVPKCSLPTQQRLLKIHMGTLLWIDESNIEYFLGGFIPWSESLRHQSLLAAQIMLWVWRDVRIPNSPFWWMREGQVIDTFGQGYSALLIHSAFSFAWNLFFDYCIASPSTLAGYLASLFRITHLEVQLLPQDPSQLASFRMPCLSTYRMVLETAPLQAAAVHAVLAWLEGEPIILTVVTEESEVVEWHEGGDNDSKAGIWRQVADMSPPLSVTTPTPAFQSATPPSDIPAHAQGAHRLPLSQHSTLLPTASLQEEGEGEVIPIPVVPAVSAVAAVAPVPVVSVMSEVDSLPATRPVLSEVPTSPPVVLEAPVTRPVLSEVPTSPPVVLEAPVTRPVLREVPSAPPVLSEAPVTPPVLREVPVTRPVLSEVPSAPPVVLEAPVTRPVLREVPTAPPVVSEVPVTRPVLSGVPVTRPVLSKVPVTRPFLSEVPSAPPVLLEVPAARPVVSEVSEVAGSEAWRRRQVPQMEGLSKDDEGGELSAVVTPLGGGDLLGVILSVEVEALLSPGGETLCAEHVLPFDIGNESSFERCFVSFVAAECLCDIRRVLLTHAMPLGSSRAKVTPLSAQMEGGTRHSLTESALHRQTTGKIVGHSQLFLGALEYRTLSVDFPSSTAQYFQYFEGDILLLEGYPIGGEAVRLLGRVTGGRDSSGSFSIRFCAPRTRPLRTRCLEAFARPCSLSAQFVMNAFTSEKMSLALQDMQHLPESLRRLLFPSPPTLTSLRLPLVRATVPRHLYRVPRHWEKSFNPSQLRAIAEAGDEQKTLTLIKGPPGTGKTRTILGIVAAFLNASPINIVTKTVAEKVLITAPSNQAIDELCLLIKHEGLPGEREGQRLFPGKDFKMIRIGDIARMNPSLNDLALSEVIDVRLNSNPLSDVSRGTVGNAWAQPSHGHSRMKHQDDILKEANVICGTLASCAQSAVRNCSFNRIIIDEATQATEPETLLAMVKASKAFKKLILVGDECQLPPTVLTRLKDNRRLYQQSFFERCLEREEFAPILLEKQYRMIPSISRFIASTFYTKEPLEDADLVKGDDYELKELQTYRIPLNAFTFFQVDGTEKGDVSKSNQKEGDMIIALVEILKKGMQISNRTIGIIAPYRGQVQLLSRRLKNAQLDEGVLVNTVDAFQGSECDIILFSCVRSGYELGFLTNARRINVALSRAKVCLWVVGNSNTLQQSKHWAALIQNAKDRNAFLTAGACRDVIAEGDRVRENGQARFSRGEKRNRASSTGNQRKNFGQKSRSDTGSHKKHRLTVVRQDDRQRKN
jgi:hypothetical protein